MQILLNNSSVAKVLEGKASVAQMDEAQYAYLQSKMRNRSDAEAMNDAQAFQKQRADPALKDAENAFQDFRTGRRSADSLDPKEQAYVLARLQLKSPLEASEAMKGVQPPSPKAAGGALESGAAAKEAQYQPAAKGEMEALGKASPLDLGEQAPKQEAGNVVDIGERRKAIEESKLVKRAQGLEGTLNDPAELAGFVRKVVQNDAESIELAKRMDPRSYGEIMRLASDPDFKAFHETAPEGAVSYARLRVNPHLLEKLQKASDNMGGPSPPPQKQAAQAVVGDVAPQVTEARGSVVYIREIAPGEIVALGGGVGPAPSRVDGLAGSGNVGPSSPLFHEAQRMRMHMDAGMGPREAAHLTLEEHIHGVAMDMHDLAEAWVSGDPVRVESAKEIHRQELVDAAGEPEAGRLRRLLVHGEPGRRIRGFQARGQDADCAPSWHPTS